RDVAAIDISGLAEAAQECCHHMTGLHLRDGAEEADHRQRRLLRARRERPRRRAAEQRNELASSDVEHGLLPRTRCASLLQAGDAAEASAGPWRRPESF